MAVSRFRRGASDESPGSDLAGGQRRAALVSGGGDLGDLAPADASVEAELEGSFEAVRPSCRPNGRIVPRGSEPTQRINIPLFKMPVPLVLAVGDELLFDEKSQL